MATKTKASPTQYILDSSREFSIYTCQNRGIPSISDGLKDAQRKALFVIKPKSDKIKTISLAGELISSNIYLHGDASAADTLSLMAATYCNNVPFLQGIGAFGTKVGPTEWGAPRYTYLKKNAVTEALIYPDYDIIPLKENYDGSVLEPKNFLPLVPLVLLNGISGIAVGWSTEILPRRLEDLIDACIKVLDNKKFDRLVPIYDYLDCSTRNIGGNAWEFTGKVKIDGSTVWILELPPSMTLEKFKARLNQMEDDDQIQTYIDRSTKEIKIEVRFKRGTISGWTEEKAIDFFKLKSKTTERLVVLDWDGDSIKQYEDAETLVKDFVAWRLGWYVTRYNKLVADATYTLCFNLALKECIDKNLPKFLPTAQNKAAVVDQVRKICEKAKIPLDDDQVDRIASLPSYRWAKDAYDEITKRIAELTATIAEYQDILANPDRQKAIYKSELQALKKLPRIER